MQIEFEASKPKWVDPNEIKYGVKLLKLGGFHIILKESILQFSMILLYINWKYITARATNWKYFYTMGAYEEEWINSENHCIV